MTLFGLVAEGPSDHAVLENILIGLFEDDISDEITPLQPIRDATNEDEIKKFGGWYKVFEYCRSQDFRDAFQRIRYFVVQIDTDVSEQVHFDVKQTNEEGRKLLPEELVEKVIDKFKLSIIEAFGQEFFDKIISRIVFAISVDEIECWLLPLYYTDKIKEAINNCDYRLHQKAGKFEKNYNDYDKVSKDYRKNKVLMKVYKSNPSLKIFIESVLEKKITP
ncbi:hypothetical protein VB264_02250 [Arcicella aquatica]|uniref:Uncharacterized protein n=1 Tax=Arcicella aquatica TaxID=217141 RepID=A0ABU5QHQ4_9BACT|nr:hypothetical protein [Arcicella aquatica]MEA5256586.1 hypothetical protein [Arcicella aquatica]